MPPVIARQVCVHFVYGNQREDLISCGQTHKGWFVTSASDVTPYGLCCLIVSSCSDVPLLDSPSGLACVCKTSFSFVVQHHVCVCRCTPFCALTSVTLWGGVCTLCGIDPLWSSEGTMLLLKNLWFIIIVPVFLKWLKMNNVCTYIRMYICWVAAYSYRTAINLYMCLLKQYGLSFTRVSFFDLRNLGKAFCEYISTR